MQVSPAGDRAILVSLGRVPAADLHAAARRIRAAPGVLACVVGEESLYVISGAMPRLDTVEDALTSADPEENPSSRHHSIRVSFAERQAPDLAEFLAHTNLSVAAFKERLTDVRLTARFLGFRAGFAYLDGWPLEWQMPRRPTSRPVARGSFAIAGEMAGFYPIDTPGGWNVLGRTDAVLWDPSRDPPNLIAPGDEILIAASDHELHPPHARQEPPPTLDGVEILSGGQLATIVRRADYRHLDHGLPPGGPFDERSAATANRAVGNPPDAALLECALVGPRLRFTKRCAVAWSGAGCDLPSNEALTVEPGHELAIGRLRGMRGYLGVRAGHSLAHGLESGSTDDDPRVIRAGAGPHGIGLTTVECEVTAQLNRVGIRLRPLSPIAHAAPASMKSCGMQFGTLQLHPDGSLVAMGPDHPVTGGYLQPMTVLWNERWKLGQLAPGERVRFVISR